MVEIWTSSTWNNNQNINHEAIEAYVHCGRCKRIYQSADAAPVELLSNGNIALTVRDGLCCETYHVWLNRQK